MHDFQGLVSKWKKVLPESGLSESGLGCENTALEIAMRELRHQEACLSPSITLFSLCRR